MNSACQEALPDRGFLPSSVRSFAKLLLMILRVICASGLGLVGNIQSCLVDADDLAVKEAGRLCAPPTAALECPPLLADGATGVKSAGNS